MRLVLALLLVASTAGARPSLVSEAERSGFQRTGRYPEVIELCGAFAEVHRGKVACTHWGMSPEGRPLLALVASADGVLDAKQARERKRPVILIQGGIHAGEIDGKDGGFWALRELLDGKIAPGLLGQATVIFVPVFNADGHERFGPNHRPNQRGPREMGFRATAQNLNLNRDYTKGDAPEMRAMLALLAAWDPIVYVDLHTTDGAQFEHDIAIVVSPEVPRGDALDAAADGLRDAMMQRLARAGHLPLPFYPSFNVHEDPTSGIAIESSPPRYSNAYWGTRNRLGILVETHSWRPHPHRVKTVRNVLAALFEQAMSDLPAWRQAAEAADQASARLAGQNVVLLEVATAEPSRTIDFRGYAYRVETSEVSGQRWISYDERRPQIWKVGLHEKRRPRFATVAPRGGYLVPAAHAAWVGDRLRLHGIEFRTVPGRTVRAEAFRVTRVVPDKLFEGRHMVRLEGAWQEESHQVPAGSLYVPIAQPRARLVMHLLEPVGPDSFAAWGFFAAAFEHKEYMEDYVLEAEARRMMRRDPKLAAEFKQQLADPKFAASPQARLDFFYRRHPAWDRRTTLYPVLRVERAP